MKIKFQTMMCCVALAICSHSSAQNGNLDLTFSTDGSFGFMPLPNDVITSEIIQTNNQIFAFLSSVNGGSDAFIMKLHDDGSYDNTFGSNGILTVANTIFYDAVLSNEADRIYLCATHESVYSVCCYHLDGSIAIDWIAIPFTGGFSKIDVDGEGNIILTTGHAVDAFSYSSVIKYNTNLQLVTSFGTDGMASGNVDGFSYPLLEIDNNDRIVVASYGGNGSSIQRFNTDGTIDNTFNNALNLAAAQLPNWILDIAIANDNSIYVQPNTFGYANSIFKLTNTGAVDTNFGLQGQLQLAENEPDLYAATDELLIEPNGGLIILGTAFNQSQYLYGKYIARLDASGNLDNNFANGIHAVNAEGHDMRINFHCATLQDDGKVLSMDQVAIWLNQTIDGYDPLITRFTNTNGSSIGLQEDFVVENYISIYPNPTSDALHFNFQNASTSSLSIKIFDATGKCVINEKLQSNAINVGHLQSGFYQCVVERNNSREILRFMKL